MADQFRFDAIRALGSPDTYTLKHRPARDLGRCFHYLPGYPESGIARLRQNRLRLISHVWCAREVVVRLQKQPCRRFQQADYAMEKLRR